ncbi:ribokinase [Shewanella woodyi]|uniref:ribokinase n=1 Tax=Shewanella woodyi TaxID=60961 RepID=UPI0007F89BA2|nr:ribokinase [Shewanella woodyi]
MSRIVIIGSANVDHVMSFDYLPTPGQTLLSQQYRIEHGGKGANQALACARLATAQSQIDFICHLGCDAIADEMSASWIKDGISPQGMSKLAGEQTGSAMIFLGEKGANAIGVALGANASLTPQSLEKHRSLITDANWLLIQLETPTASVAHALNLAKSHGTRTILNPAPAATLSHDILRAVDIITPNETEAQAITGIEVSDIATAKLAAQMLHQLGPSIVIITLGQQGAYLSCDEFKGQITAPAVDAVDTVAAGDTFNGALTIALSEGESIVEAVKFANRAAAKAVTKPGAQRSIPYRSELVYTQATSRCSFQSPRRIAEQGSD